MQNIDEFIDDLFEEQNGKNIDQDLANESKAEMKTMLIAQIKKEAVSRLSDDKIEELANLVESQDFTGDDMFAFLQQSGINLNEVADKTKRQFREFYLDLPEEQQ